MDHCSSYSKVQRFEENAASEFAPDVFGGEAVIGEAAIGDTMLLFAADNVDHSIVTLNSKGNSMEWEWLLLSPLANRSARQKLCDLKVIYEVKVPIATRFAMYSNIKLIVVTTWYWPQNQFVLNCYSNFMSCNWQIDYMYSRCSRFLITRETESRLLEIRMDHCHWASSAPF